MKTEFKPGPVPLCGCGTTSSLPGLRSLLCKPGAIPLMRDCTESTRHMGYPCSHPRQQSLSPPSHSFLVPVWSHKNQLEPECVPAHFWKPESPPGGLASWPGHNCETALRAQALPCGGEKSSDFLTPVFVPTSMFDTLYKCLDYSPT